MKKLLLLTVFIASSFVINYSNAQVRFNVNIGLGLPQWIPGGYAGTDFYYMPEIDAYYNIRQQQFIYLEDDEWIFSARLPRRFEGFDLYNCHKFPIFEANPYLHDDFYRNRYAQYRGNFNFNLGYRQPIIVGNIYSRNNERYEYNRNPFYHPQHRFEERRYEDHDRDRNHRERH